MHHGALPGSSWAGSMGTRGCKELCLSGVRHIEPASVTVDLELSQGEWTGRELLRRGWQALPAVTAAGVKWQGRDFWVKRVPVVLISLMDLCIGGISFTGPFFFSSEPVVWDNHVCDQPFAEVRSNLDWIVCPLHSSSASFALLTLCPGICLSSWLCDMKEGICCIPTKEKQMCHSGPT